MEFGPRERWAVTVVLGALACAAVWVGYRQFRQEQEAPVAAALPPAPRETALTVHVTGAVRQPGLHRVPPGARVGDAVAAAEPLPAAVPDALNLAAALVDGDKVFVPAATDLPREEGAPAAASLGAQHAPLPGARPGAPAATARKVNINAADEAELATVPGIGPTLAGRIVQYRKAIGRYRRLEDLLQVSGISEAKLAQLKPYLAV